MYLVAIQVIYCECVETMVTELRQTLFSIVVGDEIEVMSVHRLYLNDHARLCEFI
jgi:hypothetical protein